MEGLSTSCNYINDALAKANLKSNAEVVLLGDINIDLKDKLSPATKELLFTTGSNGLVPKITNTTRHSCRDGIVRDTCIDHIYTNSMFIAEARTLDLNVSDHLAVLIRRKKIRVKSKKTTFVGRSYVNYVKEDFQEQLIGTDWHTFYSLKDPNECWVELERIIRVTVSRSCPLRTYRVKEIREPWVSNELLEEIKDKDYYLRKAKISKKEEDWVRSKRERNRVCSLVRKAKKLEKYGIRVSVLNWCTDYLRNRSQCTLANNCTSSSKPLTCGIPQGFVLGPLFFIVYANDLQQLLTRVNVQLYADDTVLYTSGANIDELKDCLQFSLNKMLKWCRNNKLSLNPSKTKMVQFGTRQALKKAKVESKKSLTLMGKTIQSVPSFKYLGFTLDMTLNFKSHIADVIKKVMHKKLLLTKMRPFLNTSVAVSIYKMMILPYFDYCDVVYHGANAGDLDKLQRLQNKCLKTCLGVHQLYETKEAHRRTKCSYLKPRRNAHLCNFMYQRQSRIDLLDNRDIRTRSHDAPVFKVDLPNKESPKGRSTTWDHQCGIASR